MRAPPPTAVLRVRLVDFFLWGNVQSHEMRVTKMYTLLYSHDALLSISWHIILSNESDRHPPLLF